MSSKETILTAEGLKKLEDELENLRSVRRHEVAERIKVAIGYGDISENSEYDDAKNEQAFIEGRILELEQMISTDRYRQCFQQRRRGNAWFHRCG